MAKNSQIEWTHHTFNPWWGCTKVSPACDNCYAELWAKRMGHQLWGQRAARRSFSDAHWKEPLVWNTDARLEGARHRVFCASMADVFEKRAELNSLREKLWELIESTPWLDWLLLTKRPQNISYLSPWSGGKWPSNIWLGTTVENQAFAAQRMPHLLKHESKAIKCLSLYKEKCCHFSAPPPPLDPCASVASKLRPTPLPTLPTTIVFRGS